MGKRSVDKYYVAYLPPNLNEICEWNGGVISHLTDVQWKDLITDGGYLNTIWKQRMDIISVYLRYLQDKGVIALFSFT